MKIYLFISVLAALLVMSSGAFAGKCRDVPADGVIDAAGKYCLMADRVVSGDAGIVVKSKDVLVDLAGFTLSHDNTSKVRSNGIVVTENVAKGVIIKGGTIEGFSIGVSHSNAPGLILKNLVFKNIGAMAINSNAEGTIIQDNRIENVTGVPLDGDNAYSIGVNIAGKKVKVTNNIIQELYKQDNADKAVGEAVGILVVSSCEDCEIRGNTIRNSKVEAGAIGIWNAGKGFVDVRDNKITGFPSAIISVGQYYLIAKNTLSCIPQNSKETPQARSMGVYTVLFEGGNRDAFGAAAHNEIVNCAYERLTCVSELCEDKLETYLTH